MRQRGGFTLIETLIAVVVAGLICLVGFPKLTTALSKNNVRSARATILTLYARTRAAAMESGRSATLHFTATSGWVTASPRLSGAGTSDTIVPPINLSTQYGVAVSPAPTDIAIDGRGFGSATGYTMFVTHGSLKDSMVISGFGMVVK